MKPYVIHFNSYQNIREILPKGTKTLYSQPTFGWMIVRIPGMSWEDARKHFSDKATVGICELKEYWEPEDLT